MTRCFIPNVGIRDITAQNVECVKVLVPLAFTICSLSVKSDTSDQSTGVMNQLSTVAASPVTPLQPLACLALTLRLFKCPFLRPSFFLPPPFPPTSRLPPRSLPPSLFPTRSLPSPRTSFSSFLPYSTLQLLDLPSSPRPFSFLLPSSIPRPCGIIHQPE